MNDLELARCPQCRKLYRPALYDDAEGMARRKAGALIQNAFPRATPAQREQLQTGICSDSCWNKFLGG